MALASKQKYEQGKIDKLAEYLRLYNQKGQAIDYEIIVDGLRVVRRTNDPEMFSAHEAFITGDTKSIEVLFYTGTSNNNERHIFTLSDEVKTEGLGIVDFERRIREQVTEQVDHHKREVEYNDLLKENKDLKQEVIELETENEKLEAEYKKLLENQSPFKGVLGDIGSSLLESFIRRNPSVVKSLPGGEALSGLIENDFKRREEEEQAPPSDTSVSFQPKSENRLSEDEQSAIAFVEQLKAQFTKPEFDNLLLILQTLADDKSKIELILNHVNIKQPVV
jgi:hypothetical protein